ncbi:hypothetical protein U1Q18_031406, partial [Sarracenia purpurea var. burkii]
MISAGTLVLHANPDDSVGSIHQRIQAIRTGADLSREAASVGPLFRRMLDLERRGTSIGGLPAELPSRESLANGRGYGFVDFHSAT